MPQWVMPEDDVKSELKSTIAQHKERDEEGHFVHTEPPQQPQPPKSPISQFFSEHTHYSKSKDDLLDVHIGNPLHKITILLEDIKKQKAFSFTFKGSLGIMGVFLALSVFGVFGGGHLLCDKGEQSQIGVIKVLTVREAEKSSLPFIGTILDYVTSFSTTQILHPKTVLIKDDRTVIHLPYYKQIDLAKYTNYPVIVTGSYDSCSQTLRVVGKDGIEIYPNVIR